MPRLLIAIWFVFACACHGPDRDAPAERAPAHAQPGDAPPRDVSPKDASPGPAEVTLIANGSQYTLRSGFATRDVSGVRILLSTEPMDCTMSAKNAMELPGAHMLVLVPPGPDGHYFTGHPIGLFATALPAEGPGIPPWAAVAKLEPSTWKRGAHVRGVIEGHYMAAKMGSSSVAGTFEVEVCQDLDDNADARVSPSAPASPARGSIGKEAIVPKTVLALVQRSPVTNEEATLINTHRGNGGRRHLSFGFFSDANVPCPKSEEWDAEHLPQLYLDGPAGAGIDQPLLATQQPAEPVFPKKGNLLEARAIWFGWAQYDNLAFDHGAKIRGTIWAQSPSFYKEKGTFGGRFEATVCDPLR